MLACVAAIKDVHLPVVQYDAEKSMVSLVPNATPIAPQLLRYYPIPLSFAMIALPQQQDDAQQQQQTIILVDPTYDEETCMSMSMYCIVNHKTMELLRMQQIPQMQHRYDINVTSSLQLKRSMTPLPCTLSASKQQQQQQPSVPFASLQQVLERTKQRVQQVLATL